MLDQFEKLGFRTVSILGPLTNPGSPKCNCLVFMILVEPLAQVLVTLGIKGDGCLWTG